MQFTNEIDNGTLIYYISEKVKVSRTRDVVQNGQEVNKIRFKMEKMLELMACQGK